MFGFGHWELLMVLGVIMLLFPRSFTNVARSLGESIGIIRRIGKDD